MFSIIIPDNSNIDSNLKIQKSQFINQTIITGNAKKENFKSLYIETDAYLNFNFFKKIIELSSNPYCLIILSNVKIKIKDIDIKRFHETIKLQKCAVVYSNYTTTDKKIKLCRYQIGSVRDDFNFGHIIAIDLEKVKEEIKLYKQKKYNDALFFYYLQLNLSINNTITHIPENLYNIDNDKTNNDLFSYVSPHNLNIQKDLENIFTDYLKCISGYIHPKKLKFINKKVNEFKTKASVIIPVKNRVNTISDAMESVVKQKTKFNYNLIIIDNHSNDGTSEKIIRYKNKISKIEIIHIIPEENDLQIGGCWNKGILHKSAGEYSAQLDSDDIYKDEYTLQKIINKFEENNYAAVVGSYELVDFDLNPLANYPIDHKEWTDNNGHNNLLRINGMGAPRAFYTPVIRKILFPNVSYGEDYYVMLRVSSEYRIGRIFESLYLCRRWDDNTDSQIDINKKEEFNYYKDFLRTMELTRRIENNNRVTI